MARRTSLYLGPEEASLQQFHKLLREHCLELRDVVEQRFEQQAELIMMLARQAGSFKTSSRQAASGMNLQELQELQEVDVNAKEEEESTTTPPDAPEGESSTKARADRLASGTSATSAGDWDGIRQGPVLPLAGRLRSTVLSVTSNLSQRNASWRSNTSTMIGVFQKDWSLWEETRDHRRTALSQSRLMDSRRGSSEHVEVESDRCDRLGRAVNSAAFSFGTMLLVFIHMILLGVEIDMSAQGEAPMWMSIVNLVVVTCFVVELILKVTFLGCRGFWLGKDKGWNIFDAFVVLILVADVVVDFWSRALEGIDEILVLRTLRFARTVRSLRIFRIFRYIPALRTLAVSILSTFASLAWTLALLIVLFYSFGVLITEIVIEHCRFVVLDGGTCPESLTKYWSRVPESMLTLFMTISQGINWEIAMTPLRDVSFFPVALLIAYVIITIFAILNVVTGVFCNTAIDSASVDKEVATMRQVHAKKKQVAVLKAVFKEMDRDQINEVSFEDVRRAIDRPELSDFLEAMGISTDDVWTLFMLLDADQTGLIDLDEFVSGCMQLYGPAKSMQMAKMSYENKLMRQSIKTLKEDLQNYQKKMVQLVMTGRQSQSEQTQETELQERF